MAFDIERLQEYVVAGCFSAAITIILIILATAFLIGSIIDSITTEAKESLKEKLTTISINCSEEYSIDSIKLSLQETELYCKIT